MERNPKKVNSTNYQPQERSMNYKKTALTVAVALATSTLSVNVYADDHKEVAVPDAAVLKLIRVLEQNGTIDKKTAVQLNDAASVQATTSAKKTQAAIDEATTGAVKIGTKGKLSFTSPDGNFKFKFNGRIMTDATFVDSDEQNLGSGTELRRARLGFGGTINKVLDYQLTTHNGQGNASVGDAYIRYRGFKNNKITVGQHHAPFAMELADSSKYMTFIERSIGSELIQGSSGPGNRRMGVSSFHNGKNWTAQAGVFGASLNGNNGTADDRITYAARGTYAPITEKTHALHFGAGYAIQDFDNDDQTVRFRSRNGSHTNGRWIDSKVTGDGAQFFTLDTAYVRGPFSAQAEYDLAMVDGATANVDVDSYFVQADYFLTGESRKYKGKSGHFSAVQPFSEVGKNGGIGAFQIGARYASADMNDGAHVGGELDVGTVGVNWYLTKNMRVMANYNKVLHVKDSSLVSDDDNPSSLVLRAQVYW